MPADRPQEGEKLPADRSRSTAGRTPPTATSSSSSSSCWRRTATASSSPTRAAARATARRFTLASNDDWGGDDYRDVMLGVDAAIARAPWIDPARLGVLGGSYGGYMINWIVTQTDRFKAAVTERSICNMVSKWGDERHRLPSATICSGVGRPGRTRPVLHGPLAAHPRREGGHAAADHPLRARLALPDRARRAVLHRAEVPAPHGRVRPLPRRGARTLAQRPAVRTA